jgi:hypothetical protein
MTLNLGNGFENFERIILDKREVCMEDIFPKISIYK